MGRIKLEKKERIKTINQMEYDREKEKARDVKEKFTRKFRHGTGYLEESQQISSDKQINQTKEVKENEDNIGDNEHACPFDGSKAYAIWLKKSQKNVLIVIDFEKHKRKTSLDQETTST